MNSESEIFIRSEPGVPSIRSVNWGGLQALYVKEVRRFFKVQTQTIWAPAVTTLLFLVIFSVGVAIGSVVAAFAPSGVFRLAFVVMAAVIAFKLLFSRDSWRVADDFPGQPTMSGFGLLVGLFVVAYLWLCREARRGRARLGLPHLPR